MNYAEQTIKRIEETIEFKDIINSAIEDGHKKYIKDKVWQELHEINKVALNEHIEEERLNDKMSIYEHIFDKTKD